MKPAYEFHTPQFFIRNVIDGDFPSFQKDSLSLSLCVFASLPISNCILFVNFVFLGFKTQMQTWNAVAWRWVRVSERNSLQYNLAVRCIAAETTEVNEI